MRREYKRILAGLLVTAMLLTVVGCSSSKDEPAENTVTESSTDGAETGSSAETGSTDGTETGSSAETGTTDGTESGSSAETGSADGIETGTTDGTETGTTDGTETGSTDGTETGTTDGTETGSAAEVGNSAETGSTDGTETGSSAEKGSTDGTETGSTAYDFKVLQEGLANGSITMEQLSEMSGMPVDQLKAMLGEDGSNISQFAAMYSSNGPVEVGELELPENTAEFSYTLAQQALTLCTGHQEKAQAQLLEMNGFEIVSQKNYNKEYNDDSHTCAYTVGKKTVEYRGQERPLLIVAIRGTNGAEWFSNFDYSASQDDDTTVYADNFLACAQAISVELVPVFMENPGALVLICGHSRGAAAAALLGMLLNETKGSENVFCYTYATPNNYRGSEEKNNCENIFNIINPCDVVPMVPLSGLGYRRIGKDIILYGEPKEINRISTSMNTLYMSAPSIKQYYEERHSLTNQGLSEDGMTAYEIMLALASTMTGVRTDKNGGLNLKDLQDMMAKTPTSAMSDFAPLFEVLGRAFSSGDGGMPVFSQHMPAVYGKLMEIMFSGALPQSP